MGVNNLRNIFSYFITDKNGFRHSLFSNNVADSEKKVERNCPQKREMEGVQLTNFK